MINNDLIFSITGDSSTVGRSFYGLMLCGLSWCLYKATEDLFSQFVMCLICCCLEICMPSFFLLFVFYGYFLFDLTC